MDDSTKPNLQPVIDPADVWHLAQGNAFELAAQMVSEARRDITASSLNDFSTCVLEKLESMKDGSYQTFLRSSDRPIAGDGQALSVRFDDKRNLPVVEWPAVPTNSGWGMIDVPGGNAPDMVLAIPFRETNVGALPEGTVLVKLSDPHHSATAALVEILQCARRDALSAFQGVDARTAWRRLNMIINIYRNAGRVGLDILNDDDFINWRPDMPLRFDIGSASGLICRIAATSRAHCAVATHLMATWLQLVADNTEKMPLNEREDTFLRRLSDASEGVEKALEGMNLALAREHWSGEGRYECMVVMRPVPQTIPVLAIVPKQDEQKVKPMPRRKVTA